MAFWNRDDGGEWEKYQKSKENGEAGEKPTASEEFRAYFKTKRMAPLPDSGEGGQPGEQDTPLKTFLSRIRRDKAEEEDEGPPEKCPWCGGDMAKGYLWGGRGILWQKRKPSFFSAGGFLLDTVNVSEESDFSWTGYKIVWHCQACRKMVTDIRGLNPPLGERKPEAHTLSYDEQVSAAEHGKAGDAADETKEEN